MSPELIALIASFTLKMIAQYKSAPPPTEEALMAEFESHYNVALTKNQALINETKG